MLRWNTFAENRSRTNWSLALRACDGHPPSVDALLLEPRYMERLRTASQSPVPLRVGEGERSPNAHEVQARRMEAAVGADRGAGVGCGSVQR